VRLALHARENRPRAATGRQGQPPAQALHLPQRDLRREVLVRHREPLRAPSRTDLAQRRGQEVQVDLLDRQAAAAGLLDDGARVGGIAAHQRLEVAPVERPTIPPLFPPAFRPRRLRHGVEYELHNDSRLGSD
jgi:hypothetical protein